MELLARSAFCISAALLALSDGVLAQNFTTQRVSLTSEGGESNGYSGSNSISADGARVAFDSTADNLVSGDTNGMRDIFLHDRSDGRTVRVSVGTGGLESNGDSLYPSISADGQFVAFTSYADNLVVGDTNGKTDVFLHDTLTGQTTRVSVSSQGEEANGISLAEQPWVLSGHGLLVGFSSFAENLVPGDSNGKRDAFVHDMQTGQTIRISVDSTGLQGNDDSGARICVSADGLCAIFDSWATNLGGGGTAPKQGVFFHDLVSGQTLRVSSPTWEGFGDQVSGDGHYVIYTAYDGFNYGNVFLYDRQTGQTSAIGVGALGSLPNGHCWAGSISLDGRFVALTSSADNMAPDFNQSDDVFLVDRSIAKTTLLSWGFGGAQLNLASGSSCLSADASTVSYASSAGRVVPFDQNVASDVFAVALTGCAPTVAAYCVPSATSIPGCEASLDGSGFPSLSNAAAFALSAAPMPGGTTGLMFWGLHGPRDQVFGTQGGRICVASPFARTLVQASGGTSAVCNGHIDLTLQDLLATDPFQVQAGHTIHVQAWFRDAGSPDGFGLSSGVWFNVCP